MGRVAVGGGFVHQALALEDAEAMLLVNGNEAESGELYVVFDEGVGAEDQLRFSRLDAFESSGFFGGLETADEELDSIATAFQDAARGKKMLHGKDFGGGHERGLAAVFYSHDGGLQGDDGFAAAHVPL